MTPPPTDEFENLRLLRDAAEEKCGDDREAWPAWYAFTTAALAALGPEGCVTRELELLKAARDGFKKDFADAMDWMREARAERDASLAKHKLVSEAYADYRTTTDEVMATLERHAKDAEKENRVLLARLVKLSAACRVLDTAIANREVFNSDDEVISFREALNEIPPR